MNVLLGQLPGSHSIVHLAVALPLGISFYTFQIVSYIVDVYRGEIEAEKSLLRLGLYLCMFPQLTSGPIVKYSVVSAQLKSRRDTIENLESGLKLFTIGLGFKVLIADRIGLLWNDIQTIGFESISTPLAWLGTYGYTLQLYFDFYGYSLMAIGVGKMMGFTLPDNFNHPYMSKSISEFWRRWHMTLGNWFKNYVYIPLGGNRRGTLRLVLNLLIVWLFTGLWHGANWNFILWGWALFLLICMEKLFLKKVLEKLTIIPRLYVLTAIPMTWMLFAIAKLSDIRIYFGRLFSVIPGICVNTNDFMKYFGIYKWYFAAGIFFCLPFAWKWYVKHEKSIICTVLLFAVFWYSIYQLANGLNNPFMYFRF
jgi:alginate O-acetyltransferase complex protein AlgI